MKVFYLLLAFLLPLAATAGNGSGNVSAVTQLGGYNTTTGGVTVPQGDTSFFDLFAAATSSTTADYYPFYKDGALYQVPSGHYAQCNSFTWTDPSTGDKIQLMSATATFANGASSVTGGVWQGGASGAYMFISEAGASVRNIEQIRYSFGASTWPGFQPSSNSGYTMAILHCQEISGTLP